MKTFRAIAAVAFFAVITAASIRAQQPRPTTTTAPATGALADTKIALVNTEEFVDEKTGIVRLVTAMKAVNGEFQPRQTEITQLQQRITQLQEDIEKTRAVADPKTIQQKMDQLDLLKKDYQRKGEDAQAAYNKRRGEVFQPLQDDIGKALEVYAKAHGITVIIDASQVPLVYAADSLDITRPFINEFNSKNPATASAATPKD